MKNTIGIIGGSGLYQLAQESTKIIKNTPYGDTTVYKASIGCKKVIFLPRHGSSHHLPPHNINYRANLYALHMEEVDCILSTAAVGSLKPSFSPGKFGYVHQFIDYTKNRQDTFFDSFKEGICHSDMTHPYHQELNHTLEEVLTRLDLPHEGSLTLIVTQGPRFESPAEIKAFQLWGADIVGMTGYPEVSLARELGIPFSTLAICSNFAAGISKNPLSHQEVIDQLEKSFSHLLQIIESFIKEV